jgi:predicted transcriptional regulator
MTAPTSKSVTLYLSQDTIEKISRFAEVTFRSKSLAAEVLMLHGIANYDVIAASPQQIENAKVATKANTRVKKAPVVKGLKKPAKKRAVAKKRAPAAEVKAA